MSNSTGRSLTSRFDVIHNWREGEGGDGVKSQECLASRAWANRLVHRGSQDGEVWRILALAELAFSERRLFFTYAYMRG